VNLKPKIHYYTLHYNGVSAGDFFTNKKGLVTCKYCLRQLKAAEQKMHPTKNGRTKSDKLSKPAVFSG